MIVFAHPSDTHIHGGSRVTERPRAVIGHLEALLVEPETPVPGSIETMARPARASRTAGRSAERRAGGSDGRRTGRHSGSGSRRGDRHAAESPPGSRQDGDPG